MQKKTLHDTLPRKLEGEELRAAEKADRDRLQRDLYELEERLKLKDHDAPHERRWVEKQRDLIKAELEGKR
jgi:hypothetical protein